MGDEYNRNAKNADESLKPSATGPSNALPDPLSEYPPHSIAITGMAGRFPDADSVDELWEILLQGKSTISSREAVAWDPQQRLLLQVVYEALESAGHFSLPRRDDYDDYGCYIGAVMNNYYDNLSCYPPTAYATVGTGRCFFSGGVSHHFGFTGPALTVDSACSSSLVAIDTACRAIWSGACSRAIAGGANVISSPIDYRNLHATGFLSATGQCKPFDRNADGYCRGEGVAAVVLRRLSDAIQDNDNILGVIVGSATNQNRNVGGCSITMPYSDSQVDLYRKAMKLGNVSPEDVSYVEAHGTGTLAGDPVEVRGIRDAYGGPQRNSPLHFASIKGNIGHTEATAGVAGLIKVLLMMRHGKIPRQASYSGLNPTIPPLEQDQLAIPTRLLSWDVPSRVACVNSHGASGSNSVLVIRERPRRVGDSAAPVNLNKYPLVICAASANSLVMYSKKLLDWIREARDGTVSLASLTFNLADRSNHSLQHILAASVSSIRDLESTLQAASSGSGTISPTTKAAKPVVLVCGGQEGESVGLSADLYRTSKLFRSHLDGCDEILVSRGLESLYPAIFTSDAIGDLTTLHSALFAVQYASAQAWIDCGLKVDAVVGHSFGQLTALCISGCLSLSDALTLVVERASLIQKYWGSERGVMLSLQTDRAAVNQLLQSLKAQRGEPYAEIACYNGPKNHVVVGSPGAIDSLEHVITSTPSLCGTVRAKRLRVTHGFHSKFTEPILPHLTAVARQLDWRHPKMHIEICGEFESNSNSDSKSISEHMRSPVFFQQAIERLTARFTQIAWVEAGCGSSVMQLVRGSVPNPQGDVFLSSPLASPNALASLSDMTVELWKSRCAVQYWLFHRSQKPQFGYLSLPPYQFEKTRHWLGYIAREQGEAHKEEEVEETHELIKFMRFTDENEKEAIFQVDPRSDRFQALVGGHVMAGQTLVPASLYLEVIARAALFLQKDTDAKVYVPSVDSLAMKYPIGLDDSTEIILTLKRLQNLHPLWAFAITTKGSVRNATVSSEQSTGTVCLKERSDKQAVREFKRFESLIGTRRYEILNHPDSEKMQGRHIYRAFSSVVDYGEAYRGVKEVACVGNEVVGKVIVTPDPTAPADQRLCYTPMIDSFLQLSGILVNYFSSSSLEDVQLCTCVEHVEIGGRFNPDAGEWIVYANQSVDDQSDTTSDVYVFEAQTKHMVMAAFGCRFLKMRKAVLGQILRDVNQPGPARIEKQKLAVQVAQKTDSSVQDLPTTPMDKASSRRRDLFQILSNITDLPLEDMNGTSTLEDLSIDSLMATEVLSDIRTNLGLAIDLTSFLFFENIDAIVTYVDETLGVSSEDGTIETLPSSGIEHDIDVSRPSDNQIIAPEYPERVDVPAITSALDYFEDTRLDYDKIAESTGAASFCSEVYPDHARLVLAYVVEAFAQLGCDWDRLRPGERIPEVKVLDKHTRLIRRLHVILEHGKLISCTNQGFVRTGFPIDASPAESIYKQIIGTHSHHDSIVELVRTVGSEMASCLIGEKEGLQVLFGDKNTKKTLEHLYEFWPLFRAATILLGDFLTKTFAHSLGRGKFRILEIGAGTGGTTKHIVRHLQKHGIPFEYTFTDISSSLVAAARKQFQGIEGMFFEVLDVEKPPPAVDQGAFHCVIATNCIHATRDLEVSLTNVRQMLREDGVLALVEMTKQMFCFDIIVGLLEGWWSFQDGRTHALVDERHWQRALGKSGFARVLWSDGDTPEAKMVRVVAGFPRPGLSQAVDMSPSIIPAGAAPETVVYKTIGGKDIHADIYYPTEGKSNDRTLAIALMIHGGSHILFSRKDIRPAQTNLLLDKGFLPVSLDHRLCPEVSLAEGPMVDIVDALHWARHTLPRIASRQTGLQVDGERVVVVGWSSGGQLAMSLGWTSAPQRGLRPPEAVLIFYAPTDYEDEWWRHPIQPIGAVDRGDEYGVLEAVQDEPITNYGQVGAWEPLSDRRIHTDARARIVLHINWKAQTLPVILGGLPSRRKAKAAHQERPEVADTDWHALPQPGPEFICEASPLAQIRRGNYRTPTFLIHGMADDLIPWQQSRRTYEALVERGADAQLALVEGAPHVCDLSSDPDSEGWKATVRGYEFLSSYVN
ncbi:BcPKS19, polyketide synthase [Nemania sp. FL0916]|nr:BcPKS19, polyketide synthase [Nemania sp. FL0916]